MIDNPPAFSNPYHPLAGADSGLAPFAGRQKAYEHLYQRLTDPQGVGSTIVLGRRDIGKTALLRHFNQYFDDTFIGVYLPLKSLNIRSEADWLNTIALEAMQSLGERDLSLHRLPRPDTPADDMRAWLSGEYLPDLFNLIRGRRLVWLLDDAGTLVQWVQQSKLPPDHFAYLKSLAGQFPALGLVLAIDSRYETQIPTMSPLVGLTDVFRLTNLAAEDVTWLMQKPVEGYYKLSDDALEAVYQATSGSPRLVQRFGFQLYQRWESKPVQNFLTVEDVKAVSLAVQRQSESDFQHLWDSLGSNEQVALTAITRLLYADPLTPVTAEAVERWLTESDYPRDKTAIHAALRGLEYDELIDNTKSGIRVSAGVMTPWLMEHAQVRPRGLALAGQRRWIGLAAAVALLALVLILASIASQQGGAPNTTVEPTVTLITSP
ncbi:MAG: hypothetical protein J0L63_08035 [Anaerolineae bacterium]|nr:hypothetical protein [Anaerolineae bacterium]